MCVCIYIYAFINVHACICIYASVHTSQQTYVCICIHTVKAPNHKHVGVLGCYHWRSTDPLRVGYRDQGKEDEEAVARQLP